MYPISEEDLNKYFALNTEFYYLINFECPVVLYFRKSNDELVAVDDGSNRYAKYLYWIVQNTDNNVQ